MTLTVVVAAIIVLTLALALMAIPRGRRKAVAGGSSAERGANDPEDWSDVSSEWDDEPQTRVIPRDPAITWPKLLDPRSKALDDAARLRLIEDLAVVHAAWCVRFCNKPTKRNTSQRYTALRAKRSPPVRSRRRNPSEHRCNCVRAGRPQNGPARIPMIAKGAQGSPPRNSNRIGDLSTPFRA